MATLFVNNNGEILENNGKTIETANRSYLYGDGLFETIRIFNGKPINLSVHISRMLDGMRTLKMRIPSYFGVDFFESKFIDLIQKSSITGGGRLRLSIDRLAGGTYQPDTNEVSFFIEVYPIADNLFVLNQKGKEVDLYTTIRKEKNIFSNFKTKNSLLYVMASIEAKEKGLDDLLITDSRGNILEGTSSNLFIVSNGVLYTPALEDGCLGGTMRMTLINLALAHNIRVYESPITPQSLLMANEVLLTNAINGVVWVGGYRTQRYMNSTAHKLISLLNDKYSRVL